MPRKRTDLSRLLKPHPPLHVVVNNDAKPKPKPKAPQFAKIPLDWLREPPATCGQIPPALRLYLLLQYVTKRGTRPMRLTNDMLAMARIVRQHKTRYLGVLERRGLIAVVRDGNRNPEISLVR